MKKILFLLILSLSIYASSAQEFDSIHVYRIVEEMPEFPGGEEALFEFIRDSIVYPVIAKNANISGTINISFIVEADGEISNIKLDLLSPCKNSWLTKEALRIVKIMPKWKPGIQKGKTVRVSYILPLEFRLSSY